MRDRQHRFRMTEVGPALLAVIAGVVLLSGCSGYGGEMAGAEGGAALDVKTDGEHCMVTLPEGWTWLPAKWTAASPLGTQMSFTEALYGRPEYPNWDEAKQTSIAEVRKRVPTASIAESENRVRIDYGPDGGLTILQKFDRVGCQITFSRVEGARSQEIDQWEAIVDSLERTSPTKGYTPTP